MRRILLSLVGLIMMASTLSADNDKPITVDQLPKSAQQFIQKYFSKSTVSYTKMETEMFSKSYEVLFADGSKVEFDKKGGWKEVNTKSAQLPDGILPQQIKEYIDKNYQEVMAFSIERDSRGYEVKLKNGLELKFDSKFNLIDIDD